MDNPQVEAWGFNKNIVALGPRSSGGIGRFRNNKKRKRRGTRSLGEWRKGSAEGGFAARTMQASSSYGGKGSGKAPNPNAGKKGTKGAGYGAQGKGQKGKK